MGPGEGANLIQEEGLRSYAAAVWEPVQYAPGAPGLLAPALLLLEAQLALSTTTGTGT